MEVIQGNQVRYQALPCNVSMTQMLGLEKEAA